MKAKVLHVHRAGPHSVAFVEHLPGHVMAARVRHHPLRISVYLDADATLEDALNCTALVLKDEERDLLREHLGLPPSPEPIPGMKKEQPVWPHLAEVLRKHRPAT